MVFFLNTDKIMEFFVRTYTTTIALQNIKQGHKSSDVLCLLPTFLV